MSNLLFSTFFSHANGKFFLEEDHGILQGDEKETAFTESGRSISCKTVTT